MVIIITTGQEFLHRLILFHVKYLTLNERWCIVTGCLRAL